MKNIQNIKIHLHYDNKSNKSYIRDTVDKFYLGIVEKRLDDSSFLIEQKIKIIDGLIDKYNKNNKK